MRKSAQAYLRHELIMMGVINLILNGVFAWWLTHGEQLPLWVGEGAMGPDLIITGLLLSYLVGLGLAFGVAKKRDQYLVERLNTPVSPTLLKLPETPWKLAMVLGVMGVLLSTVLSVLLHGAGLDPLERTTYIGLKAIYAAWLSMLCCYLVIVRLLAVPGQAPATA